MTHQYVTLFSLFITFCLVACSVTPNQTTLIPSDFVQSTISSTIVTTENIPSTNQARFTDTVTAEVPTKTASIINISTPFATVTPTISPFYRTPTFDPASIVTATKSPDATCPKINDTLNPSFPDQGEPAAFGFISFKFFLQNSILEALNQGASLANITSALTKVTAGGEPLGLNADNLYLKELTGDRVPELIFDSYPRFSIFTCMKGRYLLALDVPSNALYLVKDRLIQDLNKDNLPEIILGIEDNVSVWMGVYVSVFRWNGSAFQNLSYSEDVLPYSLEERAFSFCCTTNFKILDIDKNGIMELVVQEKLGWHAETPLFGPWRNMTEIISWNGTNYVLLPYLLDPPIYRFQVVQDGDRALLRGDFVEALDLYTRSLNDPGLKGWSKAHFDNMQAVELAYSGTPTPTALPDDQADYSILAAYARFHILLIHAIEGNNDQANNEYKNLLKDYSSKQPGYAFVQLAQIFWETFEKTGNLTIACEKAREYATDHPEETISQIDMTWHGRQSPGYSPYIPVEKIICPVE